MKRTSLVSCTGSERGRGQHQALDALYTGPLTRKVNWMLDLDIKAFFRWPLARMACEVACPKTHSS
jgi:hypothetical protein